MVAPGGPNTRVRMPSRVHRLRARCAVCCAYQAVAVARDAAVRDPLGHVAKQHRVCALVLEGVATEKAMLDDRLLLHHHVDARAKLFQRGRSLNTLGLDERHLDLVGVVGHDERAEVKVEKRQNSLLNGPYNFHGLTME